LPDIWKRVDRCSGLLVFPVLAKARISVTTRARVAASWHCSQMACIRRTDFARVSGLEDFEADRVEGTSLAGRMEEISIPDPRRSSAVTGR
jgi:hypothetical protein